MSEEKLEVLRRAFDAFTNHDKTAWSELVDPEVVVVPIGDWPEGEVRNRGPVWDFFIAVEEPWEPGQYELTEVQQGSDAVAARMQRHLRGKSSGVELDYD